jgi:predicted O-methyltransferase YrrM
MTIHELVEQAVSCEANDWVLPVLWGLARLVPGGTYGEVGFKNGSSALAFLIAARETGGHVYSIDIEPCDEGNDRIKAEGYADQHTFICGDSAVVNFPETLDVLFIDGSHEYQDVAADYEKHRSSVKEGGVILFHDPCSYPQGVGRFCTERKIPVFPVLAGLGMEKV